MRSNDQTSCGTLTKAVANNDIIINTQLNSAENEEEQGQTNTFNLDMPLNVWIKCPHTHCLYTTNKRTQMRRHFRSKHSDDIIIIQQEGILPQ